MHEAFAASKNPERIRRDLASNAMRFAGVPKSIASMFGVAERHRTAMRYADPLAGMSFLRSSGQLAQQRLIEQTMPLLSSSRWPAQQRAMEQMTPLMFSPTMKCITREMGLMSTRIPMLRETAMGAVSSLATRAFPVQSLADTYRSSSPRVEVVPLRPSEKCPVCAHNEHIAEELDREPDGNFGFRTDRW